MKKIVFDGTMLATGMMMGKYRSGLARVAEEICHASAALKLDDVYFTNRNYFQNFHDKLVEYVAREFPDDYARRIISKRPFFLFEVLKFKGLWYKYPWMLFPSVKTVPLEQFDVFHSFYHPFTKKVQAHKIKKCITFHDIIPITRPGNPEWIVELTRGIVKSIEKNYAISISEFSKNELLNHNSQIDPSRVFVSPLAASPRLFYKNLDEEEWRKAKSKYKLPENYFFCMASKDPRKNIDHIVKTFDKFVNQENPKELFLLLAGNAAHGREVVDRLNVSSVTKSRIVIPSVFIDEEDLAVIYSRAICSLYMSEYEGFGLPVLEAMQCGTPTISADNSSMPEVVGDAGILLPPGDEDQLAQAMLNIYSNESYRNELSEKGFQRARQFSWERTARHYSEIFNQISSN